MPEEPDGPPPSEGGLVPPLKVLRKRLNGVYRADGFSGPTRRYVLIVVLLVGLASLPTLAAIIAGTNQLDSGTTGAMDVPFLPPPSSGPVTPYVEPAPAPSLGEGRSRGKAGDRKLKTRIWYGRQNVPHSRVPTSNRGPRKTSTVATSQSSAGAHRSPAPAAPAHHNPSDSGSAQHVPSDSGSAHNVPSDSAHHVPSEPGSVDEPNPPFESADESDSPDSEVDDEAESGETSDVEHDRLERSGRHHCEESAHPHGRRRHARDDRTSPMPHSRRRHARDDHTSPMPHSRRRHARDDREVDRTSPIRHHNGRPTDLEDLLSA